MTICLFLTLIRVRATAFSNQESRNLSRISCDNRSRSVFFCIIVRGCWWKFFPNFVVGIFLSVSRFSKPREDELRLGPRHYHSALPLPPATTDWYLQSEDRTSLQTLPSRPQAHTHTHTVPPTKVCPEKRPNICWFHICFKVISYLWSCDLMFFSSFIFNLNWRSLKYCRYGAHA